MAKAETQSKTSRRGRKHSTESRSDEELFLDYRDHNDQRAFNTLVHRYQRELYGYLRRYLHCEDLAEEVFQTSFVQLHRKRDSFEEGRRFRPWLYSVATHLAVDLLRQRGRRYAVSLDRPATGSETGSESGRIELPSKTPGPLAQLEAAEQRAWVRNAVEQLPEHLRSTVMLAFFQGLKYEEIAESLEIPVGTVKSRINAAMKRLSASRNDAEAADRGERGPKVRSGRAARRSAQSVGCGMPLRGGRRGGGRSENASTSSGQLKGEPVRKVLCDCQRDFSDVRVPRGLVNGTCEKVHCRVGKGTGRKGAGTPDEKSLESPKSARTDPVRGA